MAAVEGIWSIAHPAEARKRNASFNMCSDPTSDSFLRPSTMSASSTVSAYDYMLDISNYIPAGCVRLERYKCQITIELWKSCSKWQWLGHPRETAYQHTESFLQNVLQETLSNTDLLHPFRNLHQAGWIRLEFKMRDAEWGQIRVYILPEDVGRRMIDRGDQNLRKSLAHLMTELDMAKETWDATWSEETPIVRIGANIDAKDGEVSLFQLFNTLPSPNPNCNVIQDPYAKSAMENIMRGDVPGLKTKMLPYQRRSAAMMLQKEVEPGQILDPRLLKAMDQNGAAFYCDVTTGTCVRTPRMYEAARGGICAETMGLGKTLICLALILATRELSSQIPVEYSVGTIPVRSRVGSLLDMSAATIGRTGLPWKGFFDLQEQQGSDYSQCKDAIRNNPGFYHIPGPAPRRASRNPVRIPPRKVYLSKVTLVVVPANLVRQWEREIDKHTFGLKVLVAKDLKQDLPPATELAEYDIILFSRPRFEKEARDGSDGEGHRVSSYKKHRFNCQGESCLFPGYLQPDEVYHSPLRDLHFKRIITDEGHTMGNSRNTIRTNAVIVVDFLQLSSRWIVSGTPTPGLYGIDTISGFGSFEADEDVDSNGEPGSTISESDGNVDAEQERKDLEKLGNIATTYLKARPWSNSRHGKNHASWSQYVMQPRHGSRSRGNIECLRSTLEGMIIRHQPVDVRKDIELPPLHQKVVYLDGSYIDKLSLNIFSLMIISNAITSERKDTDYLFHPRQRKALGQLVANLRQASFFWSGSTRADIEATIIIAKSFLSKGEVFTTDADRALLQEAIQFGEIALSNPIWLAATDHHEMPIYVDNIWSPGIRKAWSLDREVNNPTLIGATQLLALQKLFQSQIGKPTTVESIEDAGNAARAQIRISSQVTSISRSKATKLQKKLGDSAPALAGGIRVAADSSPKRNQQPRNLTTASPGKRAAPYSIKATTNFSASEAYSALRCDLELMTTEHSHWDEIPEVPQELTESGKAPGGNVACSVDFFTLSASIMSTASSKLSYLITEVLKYNKSEKIIIFYETDNVAYYIAQALEAMNVEHLIYAKTLSSDRRSNYIVTFNQLIRFRVLLMDISQAAFGLDVSSASRVYFVNPVLNKQVEAQAVKRAHRIGQFRPVYVETLVLRDSIEEVIIERRKVMSTDEQKKCKTVLDDETMYDWIKNVRFVLLPPGAIPGPEQMVPLGSPQAVFVHKTAEDDVDEDLLFSTKNPPTDKGKRKAIAEESPQRPSKRHQKNVTFSVETRILDGPATSMEHSSQKVSPFSTGIRYIEEYEGSSSGNSPGDELDSATTREGSSSSSNAEMSRLDNNGMQSLLVKLKRGVRKDSIDTRGSGSGSGSAFSSGPASDAGSGPSPSSSCDSTAFPS